MLEFIKDRYGDETVDAVLNFFENIGQPVPERGSYRVTRDGGLMIPLNDAASVIRLTPDKRYAVIDNPHILQPALQKSCGELRADIFEGVETPVSPEDMQKLRDVLAADNIYVCDDNGTHNAGYIAGHDIPVIIDMEACCDLNRSPEDIGKFLGMPEGIADDAFVEEMKTLLAKQAFTDTDYIQTQKENAQKAYSNAYGVLVTSFQEAWPDGQEADKSAMQKAWSLCAEMKRKGVLKDSWNSKDPDADIANLREYAQNYQPETLA